MKFSPYSDEEVCSKGVMGGPKKEPIECVCLRRKGHDGDCLAMMRDAASADGVRACCRAPLDSPHREYCLELERRFKGVRS